MLKTTSLWILTLLITLAGAVYQRTTGPTYPLKGELDLDGAAVIYKLTRSHGGPGDQELSVTAPDGSVSGTVTFRRYNSSDPWTTVEMVRDGDRLVSALPHQPPAGKIEYRLTLARNGAEQQLPGSGGLVVTRFKGAVPGWVLVPHILFMFAAMLVSNFAGLQSLRPEVDTRKPALITLGLLTIGGMILGPVIQKFAFGELWTGVPFGWDLTDNKTLIAFIFWIAAVCAGRGGRNARWWVLVAAIVTLTIFMVPHSMFGSELKYN